MDIMNKVYLVFNYDWDDGYEIHSDSIIPPKAFLIKNNAEAFVKEEGQGEIFEYEVEDFDKQSIEDHPKVMKFREFVANLECTKTDPLIRRFEHAVTGCGTEVGELLTEMKKTVFYDIYDGRINVEKVKDESCDLLHYLVMLTNILGISFDKLIELNIAKLKERFPNGYSKEAWLSRNKSAEKKVMKKVDQKKMDKFSVRRKEDEDSTNIR